MDLTKRISLSGIATGLVLAFIFSFSTTLAQTETTTNVSPELASLAKDLGCKTNSECALKFDANIEQGIALAQKYDIYTPDQEKVAITFKTEVLERLRGVSGDNFEEEILTLANKILSEKPALARTIGLTRQTINTAETIINTVKDAGVDVRTCQKSPEDLSRAELIACIKASNSLSSKEKSAGDYIPKGNAKAGEAERMLDLENSLLAGEYPGLGKIGVEEAGQICLKAGSESIADCDRIAQKFFGTEGVKHLEEARQQSTRIKEYYTGGIEKMELLTPDGQKLIGKGAIRNACDRAFEDSNLGLARACGNFAVKNGYATQNEIEDGLKIMETFSQKAQGVNFDDCRFNPESCKEFLPTEFRSQFDSQFEIFRIMSESIGFDPSRCENSYDPDIGKRCLEGAKKALSRVEEIAKNSPEARRIVDEIRGHITEGERMTERRDEFNQDSSRGGGTGPGGCRGPEACFNYCNQPANSAECIAFGAKSQIFDQNTVIQRFNIVNERNEGFDYRSLPNLPDSSGRFVEDQRFNQYPPQRPDVDPGFNRYPYPQQPVGPSPECMAAIQSGDFVKAKTACSSTTENYPRPIAEPYPICPAIMPSQCPEGQMRQQASDARGCPAFGACIAVENYKPIDIIKPCSTGTYWDGKSCVTNPEPGTKDICPMMPTVSSCPTGQERYETYNSRECGVYYGCRPTSTDRVQTVGSCDYSTQYWKPSTSQCQPRTNCSDTANSDYNSQECQGVRGATNPVSSGCGSFTAQTACQANPRCGWANGVCGGNVTTNTCPSGQYWSGTSCVVSSTTGQCPAGQYWYTPPSGGTGSGYCMSSTASGNCPAGYHSHGESGGFCMNDQENYSGTCYNSAGTATMTCPQTTYTSSCTSGQYWNGSACVNSTTAPGASCGSPSAQTQSACSAISGCNWFNNACSPSGTYGSSCTSGQYWNGSACVNSGSDCGSYASQASCVSASSQTCNWNTSGSSGWCQQATTANSCGNYVCESSEMTSCPNDCGTYTSPGSCSSGQYWNGSACVANSNYMEPSAGCAQAGGTWNSASSYCQMPTSSTSCSSGQYWNGSACVTTSTTDCPSGQYWNGTACMSSSTTYPTPSTTYPTPSYLTPPTEYPTPSYPTPSGGSDPATMCAQGGGTWNGSTCQMALLLCNQSGGNWTGAACNLATNITSQKAYYSYFQNQPDPLLAQVIRAFANLFR